MISDPNLTSFQNRVSVKLENIDFCLQTNKLSLNFSKSFYI